jgi:hypothetical protein
VEMQEEREMKNYWKMREKIFLVPNAFILNEKNS